MFVLSQSPSYFWPVTVEIPLDGGRFDKQTFDGEFKRVPNSRFLQIMEEIKSDETNDAKVAREVFVGWKGVQDSHGQDLPFSEGSKDQLLEVPSVASAVVKAFFDSRSGAKRKN